MRNLMWCLTAVAIFVGCLAVDAQFSTRAQFPTPRPAATEAVAPMPVPPIPLASVATSTPVQAAAPSTGWTQSDILQWIWTALGTLVTGLVGKQVLWPSQAKSDTAPPKTVTDLLAKFDPATRKQMDSYLLQVIQSGLPGLAVQAGASAVPGVGPVIAALEPTLRKIVTEALQSRVQAP